MLLKYDYQITNLMIQHWNHSKDNLRLNGQSKFISEIVAFEIYKQFKKKIFIIRAPRIKYSSE